MRTPSLSDPHNFGRVVIAQNGHFQKPRPVFWEWLFYSHNPFRRQLDDLQVTATLPHLEFTGADLTREGSVEELKLEPEQKLTHSEIATIGATLAVYGFFGTGDLHAENVFLGRQKDGRIGFASVDIENFLGDFSDLGQSGLVMTVERPLGFTGIKPVVEADGVRGNLIAAAALVYGYLDALERLLRHEHQLWSTIIDLIDGRSIPLRMIGRKTLSYLRYLESGTHPSGIESPFCASELEQLARGDVPYYFRELDDERLFYWSKPGIASDVDQELRAQFRYPTQRRIVEGQVTPRRYAQELLERGALQILRALIPSADTRAQGEYQKVRVETHKGQILLTAGKLRLACRTLPPKA